MRAGDEEAPDLDAMLAAVEERVATRRAAGEYPEGLEEELDAHYRRMVADRSRVTGADWSRLDALVEGLRAAAGSVPRRARGDSRVEALVEGVEQLAVLVRATRDQVEHRVAQRLDDVQEALHAITERVAAIDGGAVPPIAVHESKQLWYTSEQFEDAFRGSETGIRDRYRDLATRFRGCSHVVDVGCGRGEFLELLAQEGVTALGVELDADLVDAARARGLAVQHGDALEYLDGLPDSSLDGIAAIQLVEHLPAGRVADLVRTAARVLSRGGRAVVETVNPGSLYVYAHSFFLDPTHVKPVHPTYLDWLFRLAGFAEVEVEWRSPAPDAALLDPVPAADASSAVQNANVTKLNALLFGPQDYAVIARR